MAAVWCSFVSNLCSLISYSCSLSSYLCYPLYPPHSRYFCKDSLMPLPPSTHHPTSRLFTVTVTPPKIFILSFPSFSIRVHSCSIRVHSCSLVFIRVPFVLTHVHSCSIRVPLVFTRVHSCSFVFVRVRSCSFVFRSVWCFRYDRDRVLFNVKSTNNLP